MDRLFLTIYAKILLALAVAEVVGLGVIAPRVEARLGRSVEEALSPSLTLAAEALGEEQARGGDLDVALGRVARHFHQPLVLLRAGEEGLPPDARERLARGEIVRIGGAPRVALHVRVRGTDRVLRLGPSGPAHPLMARLPVLTTLAAAGLLLGVYGVLRPIRRRLMALSRVAGAIGEGDLAARVEPGPDDALGRVGAAFNRMADEVARLFAAQHELLHMVSHEIRAPLQRLRFDAEALGSAGDEAGRDEALGRVEQDVDELDDLLGELVSYVRLREPAKVAAEALDVTPVLRELCENLGRGHDHVALVLTGEEALPAALVDGRLLRRAVSNLIANALRYAISCVEVAAEAHGASIRIHVDDDGPGIAPEDRERVFDAFQRLDDKRSPGPKNFGLGLAIVRRVAEMHGGSVVALPSPLGGARLRLVLPRANVPVQP